MDYVSGTRLVVFRCVGSRNDNFRNTSFIYKTILNSMQVNTKKYNKMFTKTQAKIMQLFASQITQRFSIRGVAKELKMHHALAYRACGPLIEDKLIIPDGDRYALNYKENHQELAYIECLRSKAFLSRPKNRSLEMFAEDVVKKFPYGYFVLCVFGSAVITAKPRDVDVLVIIERTDDVESAERALHNIARNYTLKIHSVVVSFESVEKMLAARDDRNVMNEVLNKHFILSGAELFYKLITKGRK